MEGIQKIMNSVKVMRLKKDDILIVKLKTIFKNSDIALIREGIQKLIPKELNVKVIISNNDVEFEILRRNTQECTQVIASDNENHDHSGPSLV
jgi:hypothetical protein